MKSIKTYINEKLILNKLIKNKDTNKSDQLNKIIHNFDEVKDLFLKYFINNSEYDVKINDIGYKGRAWRQYPNNGQSIGKFIKFSEYPIRFDFHEKGKPLSKSLKYILYIAQYNEGLIFKICILQTNIEGNEFWGQINNIQINEDQYYFGNYFLEWLEGCKDEELKKLFNINN